VGILRDAWNFFTMFLLLAAVIFIFKPVRFIDRMLGTRVFERLLPIIEAIAER
jgi:hypothetical protein